MIDDKNMKTGEKCEANKNQENIMGIREREMRCQTVEIIDDKMKNENSLGSDYDSMVERSNKEDRGDTVIL